MAKKKGAAPVPTQDEITRQMFRNTFGTESGQKCYEFLRRYCQFDQEVFVAKDPHQTAYNCGKRAVFGTIRNWMKEPKKGQANVV